jgi:hypothetical protein
MSNWTRIAQAAEFSSIATGAVPMEKTFGRVRSRGVGHFDADVFILLALDSLLTQDFCISIYVPEGRLAIIDRKDIITISLTKTSLINAECHLKYKDQEGITRDIAIIAPKKRLTTIVNYLT